LIHDVWEVWLDRDLRDRETALGLLRTIDTDVIMEHPVSNRVNSVKNNTADLHDRAEPETLF
jgi:putative SOS response-associated peptidase YedK